MKGLTKRQSEVLGFIEEYLHKHRFAPSYREIMKNFGLSSVSSVSKIIEILKRKGMLANEKQCSRSLALLQKNERNHQSLEIKLPYIGYISANNAIETFAQNQCLAVPNFLVSDPEKTYILRAQGNSLNDEMIFDGDLLLVEARADAFDGEVIVGDASDHGTIIRKYHPEGNYVRLNSLSLHTPSIILRHEELVIQGVVKSLLRLY